MRHAAPLALSLSLLALSSGCKGDVDAFIKGAGWVEGDASGSLAIDLDTAIYSNEFGLNQGTLTETGLTRHDTVATALYEGEVGTTYCGTDNDACADGRISTLTVVFDGVENEIDYPLYEVPPSLTEADTFVDDLIEALETCVSTLDIDVDATCVKTNY